MWKNQYLKGVWKEGRTLAVLQSVLQLFLCPYCCDKVSAGTLYPYQDRHEREQATAWLPEHSKLTESQQLAVQQQCKKAQSFSYTVMIVMWHIVKSKSFRITSIENNFLIFFSSKKLPIQIAFLLV